MVHDTKATCCDFCEHLGARAPVLHCRSCSSVSCHRCMEGGSSVMRADQGESPHFCKLCQATNGCREAAENILMYPECANESPVLGCENNKILHLVERQQLSSLSVLRRSNVRNDDYEEDDDFGKQFSPPLSELSPNASDTDSLSTCTRNGKHSFQTSLEPVAATLMSKRSNPFDQDPPDHTHKSAADLDHKDTARDDLCVSDSEENQTTQPLIDFESNHLIWLPPPPKNENDDPESRFFEYEDAEEDSEHGDTGKPIEYGNCDDTLRREEPDLAHEEILSSAELAHFEALVSQLLIDQGVGARIENCGDGWVEIVASLAWQAAKYVKPYTSIDGSMDPGDYVKIKCIASGFPRDSTFVKGIVCSKYLKSKRMISQHNSPRLLLIGGALDYQKNSDKLASLNVVLEQEKEHIKNAVSKIEGRQPNVVLVEESDSSYPQERLAKELLAKEISLVPNVKKSILERISQCTGARIAPSIDNLASATLGHCQMFRLEKVTDCSPPNNSNKKYVKTLMFFEGCPRRLGGTVLLSGACCEELKKVKHVVKFAIFAAYHLSLESSYLADEGATLPESSWSSKVAPLELIDAVNAASRVCPSDIPSSLETIDEHLRNGSYSGHEGLVKPKSDQKEFNFFQFSPTHSQSSGHNSSPVPSSVISPVTGSSHLSANGSSNHGDMLSRTAKKDSDSDSHRHHRWEDEYKRVCLDVQNETPHDYLNVEDHQSILVSVSTTCTLKGTVCECSQFLRIKFYGSYDKPLGKYLRDDLLNQKSCCPSCKQPAETHVRCYTHQRHSLTISVRQLPSLKLAGEHKGKIWMWHRCLKCKPEHGIPPAKHRVVMSDSACGLSFGKFLELSFSNHATSRRIASCGHSLQRDCLHFYGFGSMVAVFRYSPVNILSVVLPPPILDFALSMPQEWINKEASVIYTKMEQLYLEVFHKLHSIERNIPISRNNLLNSVMHKHTTELKSLLEAQKNHYDVMLQPNKTEEMQPFQLRTDILELNCLWRDLVLEAHFWDRKLYTIESVFRSNSNTTEADALDLNFFPDANLREWNHECKLPCKDGGSETPIEGTLSSSASVEDNVASCQRQSELQLGEANFNASLNKSTSSTSCLSEKIDLTWNGLDQLAADKLKFSLEVDPFGSFGPTANPSIRKAMFPARVYSFDSALSLRRRPSTTFSDSSLDSSGDLPILPRDRKTSMRRAYSEGSSGKTDSQQTVITQTPMCISSASDMLTNERARLLPSHLCSDTVVPIYDDELTSVVAYAMTSEEYYEFLLSKVSQNHDPNVNRFGDDGTKSPHSSRDDTSNPKETNFTISFDDGKSSPSDKARYSVVCYFAEEFDAVRGKCCTNDIDYIRSLSRCKRWRAQGGKSNAYFAKTLDERFIIKEVTRTELDSFVEFAPDYFKYLTESLASGSPTCLAKILGLYQVVGKNLRGGQEMKMDIMVMENIFFRREITRIYDLKGSLRSRYNPDTSGNNKVLLDLNLLETLHTKPIFLGSQAKRRLERAVWNDTSFLTSVNVMDYSLLVGIDEERKELVIGIIDYLRKYTWDKQLETWVKASGILGGPKNTSPTVISPIQYKKRFRKAMSKYFLTVPDKWSS